MGKFKIEDLDNSPWGLIVYDIVEDGCLNGLWTNPGLNEETMNEIAKYKGCIEKGKEPCIYAGDYDITYIENNKFIEDENRIFKGTLTIKLENERKDIFYYSLERNFEDNTQFKGRGFKIGKQLVVFCLGMGVVK
jgi:hypothetical protein